MDKVSIKKDKLWLNSTTVLGFESNDLKTRMEAARPFPHIIIDDFLEPMAFDRLLRIVQTSPKEPNQSKYGLSYGKDINWGYFPDLDFLRFLLSGPFRQALTSVLGEPVIHHSPSVPQLVEFLPGSAGFSCHNDVHENYDIVSLLYFCDPKQPVRGGELCLHNEQKEIVKILRPKPNRFIIFKISERSFHSVADISPHGGPRLNLTVDWELPVSTRANKRKEVI